LLFRASCLARERETASGLLFGACLRCTVRETASSYVVILQGAWSVMFRLFATLLLPALLPLPLIPGHQDEKKTIKVINLEKLNTAKDEDDPHVSSSGLTLLYSSNAAKKFDLCITRRADLGRPWTAGKPVGDYVQTEADDRSAFLTKDGVFPQFLYFATKKDKKTKNFDIFVAVKQDRAAAFSAPTPINTISTEADELHPWLTADGKELYFSRKTADGWRVCVATRKEATGAAGFGEPKLIAELPAGFHHATLAPNKLTMYLQGPLDKKRWGLFRSVHQAKGWTTPEPLDELNDPEGPTGDRSPCLSRDGVWLYFASDRPGGKGGLDLYMVRTSELKKR
jgi:hypothetical protein